MILLSAVPDIARFHGIEVPPAKEPTPASKYCSCADELCDRHSRDELYRRPMKVCWSMSNSQPFHGELPNPSQQTKEIVQHEAILIYDRESNQKQWMRFIDAAPQT